MARIYALLKPDGDLLIAHPRGGDWRVSQDRRGIDARGRNLTVFLNGLDVLGLNVSIPARNDKEARRAAPFAIEDELAETVEDSHVALADFDKDNAAKPREINVVSNAAMTALIQSLSEQGFDEAELVAAHSLLPSGNTLFEAPGLVLGRLDGRGFALDPSLGRDVLIGITEANSEIEIYGAQVARAMGRSAQGAGATSLEAFLIQLATWAEAGRPHIRLRQGAFEARRQVDMAGFGRWKFAGALAEDRVDRHAAVAAGNDHCARMLALGRKMFVPGFVGLERRGFPAGIAICQILGDWPRSMHAVVPRRFVKLPPKLTVFSLLYQSILCRAQLLRRWGDVWCEERSAWTRSNCVSR